MCMDADKTGELGVDIVEGRRPERRWMQRCWNFDHICFAHLNMPPNPDKIDEKTKYAKPPISLHHFAHKKKGRGTGSGH